jgi:ABC-type molybdate transport system ATPase subunit
MKAVSLFGLEPLLDRSPDMYSSGERFAFELVLAVATSPIVVIDDLVLDPKSQLFAQVRELLALQTRVWNGTVVFATRNIDLASRLADTLLLLRDGQVTRYGQVDEVWPQQLPNSFSIDFLGEAGVAVAARYRRNGRQCSNDCPTNVTVNSESELLALLRDVLEPVGLLPKP